MLTATVVIPVKRKKLFLYLIFYIAVLVFAAWLLFIYDGSSKNLLFNIPAVKYSTAAFCLLSIMIGLPFVIKPLLLKSGVEIDNTEIRHNTIPITIKWLNVTNIAIKEKMNYKFIVIWVNNPEEYIKNAPSRLQRKFMEINYQNYGTPLTLSPIALDTDIDTLYAAVERKWYEFKSSR